MAMHGKSMLAAALFGALVIGTPALARHGGGGGGGAPGGGSMRGGSSGAAPAVMHNAAPSTAGNRTNGNFGVSNGAMRWSGNRRGPSGMAAPSGQWRSSRIAGDFERHGHHHRHHRGGFFPFGVFASGDYGYYDDYYYDYPYDDSYEDCYIRHVRIHGHWVRRRYCEY